MTFKVKHVEEHGDECTLLAEDGRQLLISLEGDCCSRSFFDSDSRHDLMSLVGRTVTRIESRYVSQSDDSETKTYALVITHDEGHESIMWRNESNGFYGGWANMSLGVLQAAQRIWLNEAEINAAL